jgi:MFS superfamily sulfate permease-like transporter
MSSVRNIENGVVQGVVLSVTFFIISMSQINKNVDSPTKIIGFTDDWIIYTRHHSLQTAQTNIQASVDKISKYWISDIT